MKNAGSGVPGNKPGSGGVQQNPQAAPKLPKPAGKTVGQRAITTTKGNVR